MDKQIKVSKSIIENILDSKTEITFKNRTKYDLDKKCFENIIINLERLDIRTSLLISEINLDLTKYDEPYYIVIKELLELLYSKEIIEVIYFYLYNRILPNGEANQLLDKKGNVIPLNSPGELFDVIYLMKTNGQ